MFNILDTPECMSNLNGEINQWQCQLGPNDFIPFSMAIVVVVVVVV